MDNWLYYIVVAGFFAVSQVMEKRRKQAKKEGRPKTPPPQSDASRPNPKPQRKRPTKSPDSLDEVLAEMLGIPKRNRPATRQAPKSSKPSTKTKPRTQQSTPTPSFKSSVSTRAKSTRQLQTAQTKTSSAYTIIDKPKPVTDGKKAPNNRNDTTRKKSVNLRQAVIYQTILERKYS